jgi:stage II sporulation protein D
MQQITKLAPMAGSVEIRGYKASDGSVTRSFSKEQLRAWFHLPSPSFDLKTAGGKLVTQSVAPGDSLTTVNGRGFGHGVGLSQYGAKNMADQGWGYDRILGFYYTDVTILHYNISGMRLPKGYQGYN